MTCFTGRKINMIKILSIIEIIIALLLIISILLQNKGAGLGSTFGGDMGGYYTRRGAEKFLMIFSTVLASVFIILAIANLFFSNQLS